jgi:hypothetical protein
MFFIKNFFFIYDVVKKPPLFFSDDTKNRKVDKMNCKYTPGKDFVKN